MFFDKITHAGGCGFVNQVEEILYVPLFQGQKYNQLCSASRELTGPSVTDRHIKGLFPALRDIIKLIVLIAALPITLVALYVRERSRLGLQVYSAYLGQPIVYGKSYPRALHLFLCHKQSSATA